MLDIMVLPSGFSSSPSANLTGKLWATGRKWPESRCHFAGGGLSPELALILLAVRRRGR